ncbi:MULTISPECIES: cupin domain-containing protein [unclassified Diaminobutyricimonas]|uniref:cupin domain-containing protein n=1 Tax=unclassified Diaminobutyricimonas TaxID=2643261 RepID=UPI0012F5229B|nr:MULTISPECIES: cupin domain-containing protein [unclassified Diaminobutyricimonas]
MTTTPQTLKKLTVQRNGELPEAPGQTSKALRISGVSVENTEVEGLWFGKVHTGPGEISDAHHHGEAETGGYVFKGRGFIRFGERYEEIVYLEEGDFVYVPPFVPHIEGNASKTEELVWLTTRTPDNIVVNLEDQDVAELEIDYRS